MHHYLIFCLKAKLFKEANYERVDFEANADVFVINTCTVTNTGDKKSSNIMHNIKILML